MQPSFDREKFRELIVYIAQKTEDDPTWGDTKSNKVLYWADFFGLSHLGEPVTGARYQKLEKGPAARAFKPVRDELALEGAVTVSEPKEKYEPRVTRALRDPDTDLFTEGELELVDDLIQQLVGRTAAQVSALSHKLSVGWNIVDHNEDIPYATAFVSEDDEPSEEILARGQKLAKQRGW